MNDNKMTSFELRATWGLSAIFSLRMLGMFMVLPVLTIYGMELQDANESLIGLAIGIYGLTQAIFQIPIGLLSDRFGRKPLIINGLLIFICGSVIAASTSSIWGVIIGRALQGSGAISAVVMALLSDLTQEQNRTKAMAFIGISFGITFAIAMVLGPIITHIFNLNALFWMIAILASCSILIILLVVPNASCYTLNRESNIVKDSIKKVLMQSRIFKLNISIFCLHALLMLSFVALPSQFEQASFPIDQHWKIYLITMLIAFIIVAPIIIYAEVKRYIRQVFIFCVGLSLIAEVVLWHASNNFWILIIGVQLFLLAFNIAEAILPSLISKESPAGYRGTAIGIYSTCQFLGVAIGGSIGGWIFDIFGAKTVFLLAIIVAILWLVFSLTIQEPSYLSNLRIVLSGDKINNKLLEQKLKEQPGVSSVLIIPEEQSAYIKIDSKITSRVELETLIDSINR